MERGLERRNHLVWSPRLGLARPRDQHSELARGRSQGDGRVQSDREVSGRDLRDRDLARVLELLGDGEPLTIQDLRERGIQAPAQTVYELQLSGCDVERVCRADDSGRTLSAYRIGLRSRPAIASSPVSAARGER